MQEIKIAMLNYFPKMMQSLKAFNREYPFTAVNKDEYNVLLISERNSEGWCDWLPVEKNVVTDFTKIEGKYKNRLHDDIKSYYNQYWFYEIYGDIYIDDIGTSMIQLEKVLPDNEVNDLDAHIERYYRGGNINNFRMIPIGFVINLFVVVDNITGEVFVDDRLEFGIFRKVANNLAELINKLEP